MLQLPLRYYGEDADTRRRHEEWISENNFYQYIPEKNEWCMLSPMPRVMENPKMFHIEEYIYMIGQFGDSGLIQRFSILNNSWEVTVDDMFFKPFEANLVPTRQILIIGTLDGSDGGFYVDAAALYKPETNTLLDVPVDGTFDEDSHLVVCDNKCFECLEEDEEVNRLICDFDSDRPAIKLVQATEDETHAILNKSSYPEFTFDKRRLEFVGRGCLCKSHATS